MPNAEFAVIAAAGIGSRLGRGMPKCLIEVGGKTLLGHLLDRLSAVESVHITVGFMAEDVIEEARKHRNDVVFVMNHAFQTTTTLSSYVSGAKGVEKPVIYMDADIYFTEESFAHFLKAAALTNRPLIAVTKAKTEHCVFVHRDQMGNATQFSRTQSADVEWANLCSLPCGTLTDANMNVYEQLKPHLPIEAFEVDSYEVDTPEDYENLLAYFSKNNV